MGQFADLLADISGMADEDKHALSQIAGKYPDLDKAVLRQSEFSRKMNQLSGVQRERDEFNEKLNQWEAWKAANWDDGAEATKQELEARREVTALREKVAHLEATGGTGDEMTFDQIETQLKAGGYQKSADVLAEVDKRNNTMGLAFQTVFTRVTPLVHRFYREFNEDMPLEDFTKFVMDNPERLKDVNQSYSEWTAPRKLEAERKALETQRAELEEARRKLQETPMAQSPTETGGPRPMGILEQRKMAKAAGQDIDIDKVNAPLGNGTLTALAAAELRKDPAKFIQR